MLKRWFSAVVVAATVAVAASCSEPEPPAEEADTVTEAPGSECAGDDLLVCADAGTLAPVVPERPTPATGEPLRLGMMNTESSPAGSYTELSRAVGAAAEFVNAELGGVSGRPVEVSVCDTGFSAEGSSACAQRFVDEDVVAVLGGIDVFGTGIELLGANGIPFVGGIPISSPSVTAPTSVQWSGGTWGATVAFADHAARELDAQRVSIVFAEFGPISQSAEYGEDVLEQAGVVAQLVPYPITAVDLTPALQAAASTDPDAVIVLGADTACGAAFDAIAALELTVPTFHTGACAMPSILDQADPAVVDAAIFNVEGSVSQEDPDPDTVLYGQVIDRYGDGLDPIGAGTVSFRSFMNLYLALQRIGADRVGTDSVLAELRAAVDEPSFMGHPYTCDGEQLDGLPALCSPQQILVRQVDGELVELGPWIDVGAVHDG